MKQARLHPAKVSLLAFPVFFLGGLALSLHGGPCGDACHAIARVFWPTVLGGPLSLGILSAALPRVALRWPRGDDAELAPHEAGSTSLR